MNLLPGRIRESDREPCWHPASGPALPLPGIPLPPAGEFFLAIRPECISPFAADASHASARVEAIEHLGDHWLVHLDLGGGTLVAKCADAPPVREGDTCGMGFAANHVLFFDAKTGKRHPAP